MAEPPRPALDARDESLAQMRSLSIPSTSEIPPGDRSPIQNVFSDEFSLEPLEQFSSNRSSFITGTSPDDSPVSPISMNGERPSSMISPFDDDASSSPTETQIPRELPIASDRSRNVPIETISAARTASVSSATPSNPSSTRRSLSPSRFSLPRAMSPYRGQTRPSHPYAMYPQGIGVSRSQSTSTVSTIRPPERNFVAAAPPQHPYAMYSQNTVPEEATDEPQNSPIPIGFPNQNQPYQVPSTQAHNEVGDIVGPDGHMEQLPPYSRYPESLPAKQEIVNEEEIETVPTPGSDETTVASPQAVSVHDVPREHQEMNPEPDDASGGFKERLSKKGQKKICCGIPLWMFFLVAGVLLLGTVIGGVIGGLLGSQQGAKRQPVTSSTPTATVTVTAGTLDAIPLPTGHDELRPLPTGNVSVPAATLQDDSNNCVVKAIDVLTWQCTTNGMFTFRIDQDEDEKAMISFDSYNVTGQFYYGAQPPIFRDLDHPLELMLDKTNKSLGPAYFFFTPIDKLVIIPENEFPYGNPKREVDESQVWKRWSGLYTRVSSSVGDKPWFCWWNNTLVEAFIYVNENSSVATPTVSRSTRTTSWRTHSASDAYPSERTTEERGDIRLPEHNFYPRAIKIEEKRFWSHGSPAYCEQMQILENGMVNKLAPDKQVSIDEAFTFTDAGTAVNSEKNLATQGDFHDIGCFCQYFYD